MISLLSAATRIACGQMTPEHLNALYASVARASCLSARHDWERKVTAHAELFTMLGDLTGDCDLARLVSSAAGRPTCGRFPTGSTRPSCPSATGAARGTLRASRRSAALEERDQVVIAEHPGGLDGRRDPRG